MSEIARARVKLALQLLVSAILLVLVLRQVDLRALATIAWGPGTAVALVGAALLFNLSKVASALRLNIYQRAVGVRLAEAENLRLYYAGMYLNLALPGGIGGDGYKVLVLHRSGAAPAKRLVGVMLFDRASGRLALLRLAGLLLALLPLPWPSGAVHSLAFAGAAACAVAAVVAHRWLLKMDAAPLLAACGYALLVQLLQLACMAALLAGLAVPRADFPGYLAVFLASSVASVLPVSVGGLGLREVTFLYGTRLLGLEPAAGVLAATTFFLITVLSSLAGAAWVRQAWPAAAPAPPQR